MIKNRLGILMIALVLGSTMCVQAQKIKWIDRTVDGIAYAFPEDYQSLSSSQATGVMYTAANMLLAVTSLPDTAGVDPADGRAVSELYKQTLQAAMRRLGGRLRAAQDTTVAGHAAHFASVEVTYNDTMQTRYELLQVLRNRKIHGFSAQYASDDEAGVEIRDRFFRSIGDPASKGQTYNRSHAYTRLFVALGFLAIMIGLIIRARRKIKREQGQD